jgi:hypothetical protein
MPAGRGTGRGASGPTDFRALLDERSVASPGFTLRHLQAWLHKIGKVIIELSATRAATSPACPTPSATSRRWSASANASFGGSLDLIDDILAEIDIASPSGSWTPETTAPVRWPHFDPGTFEIGRDRLDMGGGRSIGVHFAEQHHRRPHARWGGVRRL